MRLELGRGKTLKRPSSGVALNASREWVGELIHPFAKEMDDV